jgi:hypothetical protein
MNLVLSASDGLCWRNTQLMGEEIEMIAGAGNAGHSDQT